MKITTSLTRLAVIALFTALTPLVAQAEDGATKTTKNQNKTKRYALIIAHNGSVEEGVKPLRYADDDGARYHETFSHLADETTLLTVLDADTQGIFPDLASKTKAPSKKNLAQAITRLKKRIDEAHGDGERVEIYLVFTGHGHVDAQTQEGYLSLVDGKLTRQQLYRDVVSQLDADYTHLIIDACHAYFMVQSRGDGTSGWQDDRAATSHTEEVMAYLETHDRSGGFDLEKQSTLGVILSTSGTAEVHEWSKLRAGVFSHQLRSALLGGADVDQDGAITYLEIEAFLAAANASVTNPRARINVYAHAPTQNQNHPLLNLSDYRDSVTLSLPDSGARYTIEDGRGVRYADIHTAQGGANTSVVLLREGALASTYYLQRGEDELASVTLPNADVAKINGEELVFARQDSAARSSSVEESFRSELFSTPFGPGFYEGYLASRARYQSLLETQQRAGLAAASSSATLDAGKNPTSKNISFSASYTISSSPGEEIFGQAGVQHALLGGMRFALTERLTLGPFLSYGFARHANDQNTSQLHRIAIGADLGYERAFGESMFFVSPRVRLGQQALILRDDTLCSTQGFCADPIGLRGEAIVSVGRRFESAGAVKGLQLDLGASMDVFSQAGITRNRETVYFSPQIGLSMIF